MKKNVVITLILLISLFILLYYTNKITRSNFHEQFDGSVELYKMGISNEKFGTFCKKLKLLDKPNEYNNILNKMRKESSEKNEKMIAELLDEINKIQKHILYSDIDIKNKFKLYYHNKASKQLDVIDKAVKNVRNKDKLFVKLV